MILNPETREPISIDDLTVPMMLDILKGIQCFCGRSKPRNSSLCSRDYYTLPFEMRSSLYKNFGGGYEEAYVAALKWLEANADHAN